MDTTRQNQTTGAQDSDDLIAELARLVAQDARTTSSRSAVYQTRQEPQAYAPPTALPVEPEAEQPAAPPENDTLFTEFDSGFQPEADNDAEPQDETPYRGEFDAIAELITSAEETEMRSDSDADAFDYFPSQDIEPVADTYEAVEPEAFEPEPQPEPARFEAPNVQASAERDPLGDIEALIGEAARVSLGERAGTSAASQPGRRVRSSYLDGDEPNFGEPAYNEPQSSREQDDDEAVSAAEAAIFAAATAAATAHEPLRASRDIPERDEPRFGEPEPGRAEEVDTRAAFTSIDEPDSEWEAPAPRARRRPGFLVPVTAGVAICAVLAGAYFVFSGDSGASGDAPVLAANTGPLKEAAPAATTNSAASESVVFNELSGTGASAETETLVSRDQTGGVTGSGVSQIITSEEGEMTLANRPVRTVTVRPDGTIVMAEDSIAGSNVLPVERPDVPTVPNSAMTADPIGEAIAMAMTGETSLPDEVAAFESPDNAPVAEAVDTAATSEEPPASAIIDPASIASNAAEAVVAPVPVPRPNGLSAPVQVASAPSTIIAPTPAPVAQQPAAPAATGNVGAWVQLSSQRSEEVARAGLGELQTRYGSLFNGASLEVSRVDLGERGIYYRVRLPQPTFDQANSVCNAIKGQGGDCFVLNN